MEIEVKRPNKEPFTIAVMVPALTDEFEIAGTTITVKSLTPPEPLEEGFAVVGEG